MQFKYAKSQCLIFLFIMHDTFALLTSFNKCAATTAITTNVAILALHTSTEYYHKSNYYSDWMLTITSLTTLNLNQIFEYSQFDILLLFSQHSINVQWSVQVYCVYWYDQVSACTHTESHSVAAAEDDQASTQHWVTQGGAGWWPLTTHSTCPLQSTTNIHSLSNKYIQSRLPH